MLATNFGMPARSNQRTSTVLSVPLLIALAFSPYYFFPSGLPQVADGALIVWALAVLFTFGIRFPSRSSALSVGAWAVLLAYMSVSNLAWLALIDDHTFGLSAAYYAYNLTVMMATAVFAANSQSARQAFSWASFAGLLACLAAIPFTYQAGASRQTLGFNNPNQLGYFALLTMTLFWVSSSKDKFTRLVEPMALAGGALLAVLSNSKAAMISAGVVLFLRYRKSRMALAAVLMGFLAIASYSAQSDGHLQRSRARLESIGQDHDDSASARGYGRITEYPGYLILGAGEGAYERFSGVVARRMEMHSSIGTIAFSYGLPGVALLIWGVVTVGSAGLERLAPIAPLFLYSLTHQGLRQPLFWMILACVSVWSIRSRPLVDDSSHSHGPAETVKPKV